MGLIGVAGLLATTTANGAILFSNISVTGPLSPASAVTGSNDIDFVFNFPAGTVGDPVDPLRSGSCMIMFDGDSNSGAVDTMITSILGAAVGSGEVMVDIFVSDRTVPGVIATVLGVTFNSANPPPTTLNVNFSRATASFSVMYMITASAPENEVEFDMAQVSLIESRFVPAPASLAMLGLGGLAIGRRRR